jgi:hypothetical protein
MSTTRHTTRRLLSSKAGHITNSKGNKGKSISLVHGHFHARQRHKLGTPTLTHGSFVLEYFKELEMMFNSLSEDALHSAHVQLAFSPPSPPASFCTP